MKTLTWQKPGQQNVAQELIKIIINYVAELREERNARRSMEKMTDEEAVARVEKSLLAAEQENKIKREYYRKFSEKLSGKQLFVIFVTPQRSNMNRMPQRNGNGGGGFPGGGFPGGGFPGGPGGGF